MLDSREIPAYAETVARRAPSRRAQLPAAACAARSYSREVNRLGKDKTILIESNCLAWDQECCMKPITDIRAPFAAPRNVVNVAGSRYVVLAMAPETNNAYSAFEIFVPPNAGTPLHAHSNEEEVFYVVRGKLRFQVGDAIVEYGQGSLVHAAKNVPHLFANTGNEEAVMIVITKPGGIEKFFLEIGTEIGATDIPVAPSREEIEKILARAPVYGITVFPPT
jgi:quercetin dioxygenase-like cupin family protein